MIDDSSNIVLEFDKLPTVNSYISAFSAGPANILRKHAGEFDNYWRSRAAEKAREWREEHGPMLFDCYSILVRIGTGGKSSSAAMCDVYLGPILQGIRDAGLVTNIGRGHLQSISMVHWPRSGSVLELRPKKEQ